MMNWTHSIAIVLATTLCLSSKARQTLLCISEKAIIILVRLALHSIKCFAKYWHGYEVHADAEVMHALTKPNSLLIGYHSRPTLDLLYFYCTIPCDVIVTNLLFNVPILAHFLPIFHVWPSKFLPRKKHLDRALNEVKIDQHDSNSRCDETKEGSGLAPVIAMDSSFAYFTHIITSTSQPLLLLPGGEAECHKLYHERFQLNWKEIPGFVRIIHQESVLQRNTSVVVFYTTHCEDLFYTTPAWYDYSAKQVKYYTDQYNATRNVLLLPMVLIWLLLAMGLCTCPRAVKLDTYFSPPLHLLPDESSSQFSNRIKTTLVNLMNEKNSLQEKGFKAPDPLLSYPLALIISITTIVSNVLGITLLACIGAPLFYLLNKFLIKKRDCKG